MVDVDAAQRTCYEVVAALSHADRARIAEDREIHVRAALAALARIRALLISLLAIERSGRPDVVGVILRTMLEVWYFGVIVLLGDDEDLTRLESDHRHWKNEFAKNGPGVSLEPGDTRKFSVWARAKRAGELMPLVGQNADRPVEWYREMYAGESLVSTHAGPSSLGSYLFVDDDVIGIKFDPEVDGALRFGRLLLAAGLASMLGCWVYERAGIDPAELNAVDFPVESD